MSTDRTQSIDLDPLGEATRSMPEIKMTGAQLMDIVDETNALRADLAWAVDALVRLDAEATTHLSGEGWDWLIKAGALVGRVVEPRPVSGESGSTA